MTISEVQHTIDELEQALPKSFIFVLDTTDQSFIYQSTDKKKCAEKVISLDQQHGIDKLTSDLSHYTIEEEDNTLILKKLSPNSFLGIYLINKEYSLNLLDMAKRILIN